MSADCGEVSDCPQSRRQGAGAGKDGAWALGQVGPVERRRQLIPDLEGLRFSILGILP